MVDYEPVFFHLEHTVCETKHEVEINLQLWNDFSDNKILHTLKEKT